MVIVQKGSAGQSLSLMMCRSPHFGKSVHSVHLDSTAVRRVCRRHMLIRHGVAGRGFSVAVDPDIIVWCPGDDPVPWF